MKKYLLVTYEVAGDAADHLLLSGFENRIQEVLEKSEINYFLANGRWSVESANDGVCSVCKGPSACCKRCC